MTSTIFTVNFYLQKNQRSRCLQKYTPYLWRVKDSHWLAELMKLLTKYDGQKIMFLWIQGPTLIRLGTTALLLLKTSWLLTVVYIPARQSTRQALHRFLFMSESQVIRIANTLFSSDYTGLIHFTERYLQLNYLNSQIVLDSWGSLENFSGNLRKTTLILTSVFNHFKDFRI